MSIQTDFERYRKPVRENRDWTEIEEARRAMAMREHRNRLVRSGMLLGLIIGGTVMLCLWILSGVKL